MRYPMHGESGPRHFDFDVPPLPAPEDLVLVQLEGLFSCSEGVCPALAGIVLRLARISHLFYLQSLMWAAFIGKQAS